MNGAEQRAATPGVALSGDPARPAQADGADRWLTAARQLDGWMRARDYAGWDPFDLLAGAPVRALCLGSRWLGVAWTQLGRRSPLDPRRLLRVPAVRNPKGIALVLSAYARLDGLVERAVLQQRTEALVDWLAAARSPGPAGSGWGYPFPWANRAFHVPAGTPSSVATAFVGHALLDVAHRFGSVRARRLALGAGEFLCRSLARLPGRDDSFCFSYTPSDRRGVHNANLLTASLLARLAAECDDAGRDGEAWAEAAHAATRFTLAAQRADGSWPYGISSRDGWVDSFHTSYSLVALHRIDRHLGVAGADRAIGRGIDYWRGAFFDGPAVSLRPGTAYPIDVHAVAHAIVALLELRDRIPDGAAEAARLGEWSLRVMRDPAGHFHYRKYRFFRNRIAYMRWTQAWMLRALAELAAGARRAATTRSGGHAGA